jgi:hypothetical protein
MRFSPWMQDLEKPLMARSRYGGNRDGACLISLEEV